MATQLCRRAHRVVGAPREVVAWIDHDRHDHLLCLNAALFTAQVEEALTTLLAQGEYTVRQVIEAIATMGG
jgi:molybdopterin-guanine dinucleotide biosynthesis protein A